jgi:ABC-type lipoprotein export system ATPase subunit
MTKWQYKNLHRHSIGAVFQGEKLNPFVSILNNVAAGLLTKRERRKAALEKSYALLDDFGIGELANKKPGKLSEEQKQMVMIARTIIKDANIIIADEPTKSLNYKNREKVIHLFNGFNKKNGTIIISTTDNLILEYAKEIISMKNGTIAMKKTIKQEKEISINTIIKE